ncbi:MAG: LysM peptidoglycan-binding domain-containing protein [Gammaproteobacteria bacterium]|nr:LysM peptidoglycan-binding domain-containing protein [Gammaproteobacteria bacterium]
MALSRCTFFILTGTLSLLLTTCDSLAEKPVPQKKNTVTHNDRSSDELLEAAANKAILEVQQVSLEESIIEIELPHPPRDLWSRMRGGFKLQIPNNSRVERELNWYASHDEYLERVQTRAHPYLHFILDEIEKRGMPSEFALLPVVESAYQPFAYSPGRAAGLWQFIPSTGRHFKLKQTWWYDGRRDVVAATRAALDYLQSLADQFDGDWELSLAAYNAGAGNVRKAIRKNKKRGKPTDYWSLPLPKETQGYVPRLLAISKLFSDPAAHGITLKTLPDTPHFEGVDIEAQLDLALAADMAGLTIEELYTLNPGFNRWATDPQGPHTLNLPLTHINQFTTKLAELDPDQRLRWERYKIRQGDSLSTIAHKHGTTVSLLKQVNKISGTNIRAGKHLLIPVSTKRLTHYSLSAEQRLAKTQATPRKGKGTRTIHIIQSGDTLWEISKRNNVGVNALARWNGISPRDRLNLGQKLVIWSKESPSTKPVQVAMNTATSALINTNSSLNYRVRSGDSLYTISRRFNVSITDLKRWNRVGKYLQPGQNLKLHIDVAEQSQ